MWHSKFMKGIKAERITLKIGGLWESPQLHILFTEEDDVIVARGLDFTEEVQQLTPEISYA